MSAFRDSEKYRIGLVGQRAIADLFRGAGFHLIEADDMVTERAPMYEGSTLKWIAPDFIAAEGFKVEAKTKGRTTWFRHGEYYEHGLPLRQWDHYRELERLDGQQVILAVMELHPPTEGPGGLTGEWPLILCQTLRGLGSPRGSIMAREPHVFFPRTRFEPGEAFAASLRERWLPPGPVMRRLL